MNVNRLLFGFLIVLCMSCEATHTMHTHSHATAHNDSVDFPLPVGLVNDFDHVLSDTQEASLLKMLKQHEVETSNQIAIATLTSLQNYDGLEEYSLDLANHWEIGQEDRDNGVLIAIYMKDRRIWIQNGTGIIHKLTDDETLDIIKEVIVPEFKKNDFYTGLHKGIQEIIKELK